MVWTSETLSRLRGVAVIRAGGALHFDTKVDNGQMIVRPNMIEAGEAMKTITSSSRAPLKATPACQGTRFFGNEIGPFRGVLSLFNSLAEALKRLEALQTMRNRYHSQRKHYLINSLKEEGRGTRNGYEASKGSKGTAGL